MIPSTFHFLRPEWLFALIPAALIIALALRRMSDADRGGWATMVDSHLLRHLAVTGPATPGYRVWVASLAAALIAAVLAMAGPTWQKLPTPVYGGSEPTVIVLSLAQSMNGTDMVPSRLARAGHKLRDMLDQAKGGDVALVIYSDRPFVAAPLTADSEVIRQMLPELSTNLMPVLGNRLDLAIAEAQGLLSRGGADKGRIVVIADDAGHDPAASRQAAEAARKAGFQLSVLGVGTADGAKLQTAAGRSIRAQDGSTVTAKLDVAALTELSQAGGGQFSLVTPDNSDIAALLPEPSGDMAAPGRQSGLKTDRWYDTGYLLLLIPALLVPFAFRRGLLFALPLLFAGLGLAPDGAQAEGWSGLWKTPDQQGQRAFDKGDFATAASMFSNPDHKAGALFRAGEFDAAAQVYASLPDQPSAPAERYNLGNALARSGKFEEAIAAYDKALAMAPNDADARFNRDLVAKLLDQKKQEQQQKDQQEQSKQKDQNQNQDQSQSKDSQQQSDNGSNRTGDQNKDQKPSDQAGSQPDQSQTSQKGGDQPGEQGADQKNQTGGQPGQTKPGQEPQQSGGSGGEQSQGSVKGGPTAAQDQTDKAQSVGAESGSPGEPNDGQADANAATPGSTGKVPREDAQAGDVTDAAQNDLKDMMDKALAGNGIPGDQTDEASTAPGAAQPLDQATEQQLRAVPDDPSGLLRARIRQYYSRLSAAGQ
ncbi:MAG: VWA domain-containing protein [Albidovulum sp.]